MGNSQPTAGHRTDLNTNTNNTSPQITDGWGDCGASSNERLLPEEGEGATTPNAHPPREGSGDRMIFNVGGRVFMTTKSTVQKASVRVKGLKLADDTFLSDNYDGDRGEYFLDRDPEVFNCVLNFLRTGHLHLHHCFCGPHVEEELRFWGVAPVHIEPCCWQVYHKWSSVVESIKRLDRDSKSGPTPCIGIRTSRRTSRRRGNRDSQGDVDTGGRRRRWKRKWEVGTNRVWDTLTDPKSSLMAKIYGWVSLFFVMLAIFSFCAATHMFFRVPLDPAPPVTSPSSLNVTNNNVTMTTNSPSQQQTPSPSSRKKTVEELLSETEVHPGLWFLDLVCLVFFTAEFLTKLVTSPCRRGYLCSINGVVDILALCPDFVEMIAMAADPDDLRGESRFLLFLPVLRLMRVFRIFRLVRHIPGLWVMVYTLQASFKELFLMLMFLFVGTLLFASAIFIVDDKEMFPNIPEAFWWAIVTMTTVGYGDKYPVTSLGYMLGSVTAISGVLFIGLTLPALVNNFRLYHQHVDYALYREQKRTKGEETVAAGVAGDWKVRAWEKEEEEEESRSETEEEGNEKRDEEEGDRGLEGREGVGESREGVACGWGVEVEVAGKDDDRAAEHIPLKEVKSGCVS
ncbi:potassium voltage-gated channel protein Shaw-like [Babylonia areolata]|uniref:potassium voltage-gated channel protein Shaw-like n=1 Tax=Babylonia areolata TaxID=304850 RepID=UPI003FCF1886